MGNNLINHLRIIKLADFGVATRLSENEKVNYLINN